MSKATGIATESRLLYEVMQELGKHGAIYRTNSGSVRLASGYVIYELTLY